MLQRLRCVCLVVAFSLAGCVNVGSIPGHYYERNRQDEYPLAIVPARFLPDVVMDFDVTGKGSGAIHGAGAGMTACLPGGAGGGVAAIVTIICLPFGVTIGAVAGAATAESAEKTEQVIKQFQTELERLRNQETMAREVADYLRRQGVRAEVMEASAGPASAKDMPSYVAKQFPDYYGVLELRVLEMRIESSGKKGAPLCLSMTVVARKIDGRTGMERDRLQRHLSRGCRSAEEWMNGGGKPFLEAISEGYAVAAKEIVDDFYLIYYPRVDVARTAMDGAPAKQDSPSQVRSAPSFVLWPIRPPLTAQRDANPFADAPKNRTGFGGLQFTEVTTLSPRFEWEPFPRSFDLREPDAKDEQFTDVVYDLEVYAGRLNEGGTPPLMHPPVEPNLRQPVYRRFGLQESQHQMDGELSYCGWYFWTVRARFRLNGAPRITEWAGAYATATTLLSPGAYRRGSDSIVWSHPDFPPTNVLYYPFRTLADPAWPSCWDDLDVFNQRLESHVEFPGSELQYR